MSSFQSIYQLNVKCEEMKCQAANDKNSQNELFYTSPPTTFSSHLKKEIQPLTTMITELQYKAVLS